MRLTATSTDDAAATDAQFRAPRFEDVADPAGIDHVYENGANGRLLMVESIGGGCGWLDYDSDGRPDLYLAQGGLPDAPERSRQPPNRLFRSIDGNGFLDVMAESEVGDRGYGQGVAIGDFDDDGFDDIYVTNVGRNVLYHNLGDGRFEEVTETAGVGDERWSSSAAWADIDLDGDLDLYVCNYLQYDPFEPRECSKNGLPALCHPRQIEAWPDELYLNVGDGTFSPSAGRLGLSGPGNKALGVAVADFNDDSLPDIYVCNDTTANFLFVNNGLGTFEESAQRLGAAFNASGQAEASMGVAVADYNGDGLLDLYLTHFTDEMNTLYRNLGQDGFRDVSGLEGLRESTLAKLGFGVAMNDFNCDGNMDVFSANGHIDHHNADGEGFEQLPQMLTYTGRRWLDVSGSCGSYFHRAYVGRGVAAGDYDDDGDLDLVVVHHNARTALLRNVSERGHWLKLRLIGKRSNRKAIGARVYLRCGESTVRMELVGGGSFAATHEALLVASLGNQSEPCTLDIKWPGGTLQTVTDVAPDQSLTIVEDD